MNLFSLISCGPIRLTALMKETGRGFTDLYREEELIAASSVEVADSLVAQLNETSK